MKTRLMSSQDLINFIQKIGIESTLSFHLNQTLIPNDGYNLEKESRNIEREEYLDSNSASNFF